MKIQARHILVKSPEMLAEVQRRLDLGEDFGHIAHLFSECPSRVDGGYLGEFEPGRMVKPFDDLAFSLEVGAVGGPVETEFGQHMIQRTA
jgi:parvulin-like peptidyl-prolyl isomerase